MKLPSPHQPGKAVFFIALGMFGLYAIEFGVVGILRSIMDRYEVSIIEAGWLVGFFAHQKLRGTMIVCLPALLLMLWQGAFAVELSFGVLFQNFSACQVFEGVPYQYSGNEVKFAFLWPVVIFGTLAATAMVYFVRRSKAPTTPKLQS